jgi:2-C-methyl-D-erythritol 2,4-cyclodiphosphate synthase
MIEDNLRIGTGFDLHRLVSGRQLLLGGLIIPHALGLEGHSDGDVVIHALIDALLGAANQGDIGGLFPSGVAETRNMSGTKMLAQVADLLVRANCKVINVDMVVICERPNLSRHYLPIKENLAAILGIDRSRIGIKAKTAEGLGPIGAGEAIAVQAVALLRT